MNDQDRQLIAQILKGAGSAAQQGFGAVVKYTMIDGILSAVTWAGLMVAAIWIFRRLWLWKPNDRDDGYIMCRVIGMVIACAVIFGFACGLESSLAQAIMPEGAAISAAIHR